MIVSTAEIKEKGRWDPVKNTWTIRVNGKDVRVREKEKCVVIAEDDKWDLWDW